MTEVTMNLSLREQLLKAGLVTEKQTKQVDRSESQQRHRQKKAGSRPPPAPPEPARAAQQAQAAKLLRDADLNRKQREKAERKARAAELRQLVEQLRIPRPETDDWFNFVDAGKVHRVAVTPELRVRLVSGTLSIVRSAGHYYLVPADVIERIHARHADAIVALPAAPNVTGTGADDPYKDFVVPEDLMW
jgi:uncharacterized protein YaiL (DUF2058 family)